MNGGTDKSTSTTSAPSWVQDAGKTYLDRANQVSTTPYNPSPSQVAGPNAMQSTAWGAIQNRAMQGSPVMGAANDTLTQTLNGGFMGSNPYLDGMVDKAQGDVVRNYNHVARPNQAASMIRSGSFGNSGIEQMTRDQDQDLMGTLGNISTQIRGGNYEAERGRMQNALGYAPQFAQQDYNDANQLLQAGNQQNQFAQQQALQNKEWWNEAQQYPAQQLGLFGNAIGNVMGSGRTNTTETPGTSPLAAGLGGALTLSQILGMFGKG
jgi:hypothetical protein